LFSLRRRIRQTVEDIIARQPDAIITIDSPGFTFRVIKLLKKHSRVRCPTIHYVAPTVWAYKPERAAKAAKLFDLMLTILPFEAPYFEKENLKTVYVGHPVVWDWRERGVGARFRQHHFIPENKPLLGMMPGSRKKEIKRLLPIYKDTAMALKEHLPELEIVMPLRPAMADIVRPMMERWSLPIHIISGDSEKKDAFAACNFSLAKSGTVALECALAGIPNVIAYRANPLTVWLVKRMIKIRFVNLINIISNREVIPEFLQENCKPKKLVPALLRLITDEAARQQQLDLTQEALEKLGLHDAKAPSDKAAEAILGLLNLTESTRLNVA